MQDTNRHTVKGTKKMKTEVMGRQCNVDDDECDDVIIEPAHLAELVVIMRKQCPGKPIGGKKMKIHMPSPHPSKW
jgi:hypothetical protein